MSMTPTSQGEIKDSLFRATKSPNSDHTWSKWRNHILFHNPTSQLSQESCEACYMTALGIIDFFGNNLVNKQPGTVVTKVIAGSEL